MAFYMNFTRFSQSLYNVLGACQQFEPIIMPVYLFVI